MRLMQAERIGYFACFPPVGIQLGYIGCPHVQEKLKNGRRSDGDAHVTSHIAEAAQVSTLQWAGCRLSRKTRTRSLHVQRGLAEGFDMWAFGNDELCWTPFERRTEGRIDSWGSSPSSGRGL